MKLDNKIVYIFTDGACKGNPGDGGWGAILKYENNVKEIKGFSKETTNNIMELTAVIEALKLLTRKCNIILTTDSKYVKSGITEWIFNWKKTGWIKSDGRPVLNRDLLYWADKLISGNKNKLEVSFIHVKAHTKKPKDENSVHYKIWYGNYMADKLATDSTKMTKCK